MSVSDDTQTTPLSGSEQSTTSPLLPGQQVTEIGVNLDELWKLVMQASNSNSSPKEKKEMLNLILGKDVNPILNKVKILKTGIVALIAKFEKDAEKDAEIAASKQTEPTKPESFADVVAKDVAPAKSVDPVAAKSVASVVQVRVLRIQKDKHSVKKCRNAVECDFPNCKFDHWCDFIGRCNNEACRFVHNDGEMPPTALQGQTCKFGNDCKFEDCQRIHFDQE